MSGKIRLVVPLGRRGQAVGRTFGSLELRMLDPYSGELRIMRPSGTSRAAKEASELALIEFQAWLKGAGIPFSVLRPEGGDVNAGVLISSERTGQPIK